MLFFSCQWKLCIIPPNSIHGTKLHLALPNAVDNIVQILLEAVYGKNSAISVDLTANQSRVGIPQGTFSLEI